MIWAAGIVALASICVLVCAYPQKASLNFDVTKHLGSKGPYPYRKTLDIPPLSDPPEQCSLTQVQLIARHGTRFPSAKEILSFDTLVQFFREHMDDVQGHEWLKDWNNPFVPEDATLLASVGEDELYWMGKRAATRYKDLFGLKNYTPHNYKFRSSTTSRTGQSGSAFAAGFFEGKGSTGTCRYQSVYQYTIPQMMDYELMPKWSCPRWQEEVEDHPFLASQMKEWSSTFMPSMVSRLAKSLTKPNRPQIPLVSCHIKAIYRACAFEVSVFTQTNTWCTMLNEEEILLLEYLDDLKHYWDLGYGFEINAKAGCALATDVATELKDIIEGRGRLEGIFRFGHAETNVFFMAAMGLYRDKVPLYANATEHLLHDRKFRLSDITPFAANYYIELYSCGDTSDNQKHLVRFLLNEREEVVTGCPSVFCPLDTFVGALGDGVGCDFAAMCGIEGCPRVKGRRKKNDMEPEMNGAEVLILQK